ncbi:DUF1491 family protein [Magnetovibrio sp. PR-2]|uniref:DUF1491 family protein n=1 Tax=Magnetovibrio sp. PR-2 TaxID=3120356 RepID=UPI002FCE2BB1
MTELRLKTGIWIKAQLRLCDQALLPVVIVRRGDEDAGQVLIKHNRLSRGCWLLARRYNMDSERVWTIVAGGEDIHAERDCDAYIEREADIDPDLWAMEVEDTEGVYKPDGQEPVDL